ncbi:hypothetical protein SOP70_08040 [Lactiplantibacillus plantarum]|uniref:hypothetical protein n=1 Tax=Lactiplantibacillus plantarum TaxID=1590 RepID=UPI002A75106D|nr:hypothetical protein [Lactiplantibacillus plantarum]MDY2577332.1 hypothetical protein [Lactiplantibacillus plantarum]
MEQSEFNTTQAINETCYGLIKQGYSLHDIYDGLGNVMDGIEPKHASVPIFSNGKTFWKDLHHDLDN